MQVSADITDWSGIIIPNECRDLVTIGNEVRVGIKSDRCCGSYFTILHKINNKRFLASLFNSGCNTCEDVVAIIDTECIFEIPTYRDVNYNFKDYCVSSGIAYGITGFRKQEKEILLDLHYDDLIFD